MRESQIEKYLKQEVEKSGFLIRKTQWIGVNGCPDRLVMTPAVTIWVELKAPDKKPRERQKREHAIMHKNGQKIEVIDSLQQVDEFVKHIREVNKTHIRTFRGNEKCQS